ncbi:MAG TPA: FixH family protein [Ktedonobacterales bacterium]
MRTLGPDGQTVAHAPRSARRFGRRAAALVLVAIVGTLALGWLADTLGQFAPRTTFTNGETQQAGLYRVALSFSPAQARVDQEATITAQIEDSGGRPVRDVTARLIMTMPTMDMSPVEAPLALNADSAYTARATFPMSGAWLVRVELTPPGATPLRADFDVPVR